MRIINAYHLQPGDCFLYNSYSEIRFAICVHPAQKKYGTTRITLKHSTSNNYRETYEKTFKDHDVTKYVSLYNRDVIVIDPQNDLI